MQGSGHKIFLAVQQAACQFQQPGGWWQGKMWPGPRMLHVALSFTQPCTTHWVYIFNVFLVDIYGTTGQSCDPRHQQCGSSCHYVIVNDNYWYRYQILWNSKKLHIHAPTHITRLQHVKFQFHLTDDILDIPGYTCGQYTESYSQVAAQGDASARYH